MSTKPGQVQRQNGYDTLLTGDPAWYDPETVGQSFHKPESIDRLVFTPPHSGLYVEQAEVLLRRLGAKYEEADRRMVLQSAPTDVDRELYEPAREAGFEVYYASHDTQNLEMYRESDLHIGYRKHGHLAHLRWRRPSVVLAEDSRAAGLNATLGTAGVRAFSSEPDTVLGRLGSIGHRLHNRRFLESINRTTEASGFGELFPTGDYKMLRGSPNSQAVDGVLSFVEDQHENGWRAFDKIGDTIDEVYENGMKRYVQNALETYFQ